MLQTLATKTCLLSLVLFLFLLTGCGNSGRMQVELASAAAKKSLQTLKQALQSGSIRNARILVTYADQIAKAEPELAVLARELAKDATPEGPTFQALETRLAGAQSSDAYAVWTDQINELKAIQLAANTTSFNDALSDPVNVLADMSGGRLPRVNSVSRAEEQRLNNSKDTGTGDQLVGNPNYGRWSQGGGGTFWQWYGQYAFFSSLMGGNRYYYDDWSRSRRYSYYHDVGRDRYTSPTQRRQQHQVEQTARKTYRGNQPFQSPYARSRQGARNISRASGSQQRPVFKSPYASSNRSSGSRYPSSTRSASSRTRSGVYRGK